MIGGAIFKRKRYIAIKRLRKMPLASSAFSSRLMVKKITSEQASFSNRKPGRDAAAQQFRDAKTYGDRAP
jgi:hypothetical protein